MLKKPTSPNSRALYVKDSRRDVSELCADKFDGNAQKVSKQERRFAKRVKKAAKSVCAIVHRAQIAYGRNGAIRLKAKRYRKTGVYGAQRFLDQYTAGFGTGFLVAPDVIATAGHVVDAVPDFSQWCCVFRCDLPLLCSKRPEVPGKRARNVAAVIESVNVSDGPDWALLRLSSPVAWAKPLHCSPGARADLDVYALGHPAGLPLKLSGPAPILELLGNGCFAAELDALAGSSGSPILDVENHAVVGIASRGDRDFVLDENGRRVPNILDHREGRGEICTMAALFSEHRDIRRGAR